MDGSTPTEFPFYVLLLLVLLFCTSFACFSAGFWGRFYFWIMGMGWMVGMGWEEEEDEEDEDEGVGGV